MVLLLAKWFGLRFIHGMTFNFNPFLFRQEEREGGRERFDEVVNY